MFIRLSTYRKKLDEFNNKEQLIKHSGLGLLYAYLDGLGPIGRFIIKLQIVLFTRGAERRELLWSLTMYYKIRELAG